MDALLALTNIAIILLLGMLCSMLAKKLGISETLVLLILGVILGRISYGDQQLFLFDDSFFMAVGILALIMVAFDSASRFRLKEKSFFSKIDFKMTWLFLLFSVLMLPSFTNVLFYTNKSFMNIIYALIFAVVVVGTDIDAVMVMLNKVTGRSAKKILGTLQTESVLNTMIVVIIPFIVLDIIYDIGRTSVTSPILLLIFQIIIGIGSGVIVGLIVLKSMQKFYHHHFSPILLIAVALLAYILAENVGGNGALAVAALGFLYGSFYVKEKPKLQEFSSMFSHVLEIMVLVLLGLVVKIPFTMEFLLNALFLFCLLIVARLGAVFIALNKPGNKLREKIFIGLNMPKGIAAASIIFVLALNKDPNLDIILQLIFAFIIYSLLFSSLIDKFASKIIKVN